MGAALIAMMLNQVHKGRRCRCPGCLGHFYHHQSLWHRPGSCGFAWHPGISKRTWVKLFFMEKTVNTKATWKIITLLEFAAIVATVLLDLFIPTLVILGLMVISLLIRSEHISVVGFKRPKSWPGMLGFAFAGAALLQLFDAGIIMPILNRLTGQTIDYSGFAHLQGNLGQLALFLVLSWTLAALGEELAYRGYFQKVLENLLGSSLVGVLLTIGISSVIFGLAHTEQGLTGVCVTTIDALFFSWLKRKFDNNLWATILAHGFYNSLGVVLFYFTGPIYGLW
jgi:membrane protease YdiL (CAAX protease family)